MTNLCSLKINTKNLNGQLEFGIPNTNQEIDEMFRLRYLVYSKKDYINIHDYPDKKEVDRFDYENKSKYFIVKFNNKIIGTIRMIVGDVLPTQDAFQFIEPQEIKKIEKNKRCEFGRFVIIPPSDNLYLPRGLVRLFMIKILSDYSSKNGFEGGYSFIKKSLLIKMKKSRFPINIIDNYKLKYNEGVLLKYFSQKSDPVVPIYYLLDDFNNYINTKINNTWLFSKLSENNYVLKSNFYTNLLIKIGII